MRRTNISDVPDYVARYLEHAPPAKDVVVDPKLRGWWIADGYYLCGTCAGRIMRRGGRLPEPAQPVWKDRDEPYGICLGCGGVGRSRNPRPIDPNDYDRGWKRELAKNRLWLARKARSVQAILAGLPRPIRGLHLADGKGNEFVIARSVRGDSRDGGWQVTRFITHMGELMPSGHQNVRTVEEAVRMVVDDVGGDESVRRVAARNPRRKG